MKKIKNMSLILALACATIALALTACGGDDEKDMTPPRITDTGITANPINCQNYRRGEILPVRYLFTDDTELGNFNIEIHSDFDHHTHSTEAEDENECGDEEDRQAASVRPWVYNRSYEIPSGHQSYMVSLDIPIPDDIDAGAYHFMIRLTDHAGWQQLKAISIRIVE